MGTLAQSIGAFGDLNADGYADLAVAAALRKLRGERDRALRWNGHGLVLASDHAECTFARSVLRVVRRDRWRYDSGPVQCWGTWDGNLGTVDTSIVAIGGTDGAIDLVTGAHSACALFEDGHVACWGAGVVGDASHAVTIMLP
jgi:hypothetical protein